MYIIMYYRKYLKYKEKIMQSGGNPVNCTPEELMDKDDYGTFCKNVTKVVGSCAEPSFKYGLTHKIDDKNATYIMKILNIIVQKNKEAESKLTYLDIILGAWTEYSSDFKQNDNSIQIFLDPYYTGRYDEPEIGLKKLSEGTLINKQYLFQLPFPLNYKDVNSKKILDALIDINNNQMKVRITNRMCGTCHRSLYYLVKKGIQYIANPEQGLGAQDTTEMRKCFDHKLFEYIKRGKKIMSIDIENETIETEY